MPGSSAGIGVWWGRNDPRNISERCPGAQSNNRAELIAIACVLETAPLSKRPLLIKTDSTYSRDCFGSWIHSWVDNCWRTASGRPVKHKELIQYISSLLIARHDSGQCVYLQYVKGHSGNEGNDGADQLAVAGCSKPELPERDWDAERELIESPPPVEEEEHFPVAVNDIDRDMFDQIISDEDDCVTPPKPVIQAKIVSTSRPIEATAPSAVTSTSHQSNSPIFLTKVKDEFACDIVYSDGACKGNGKPGSTAGVGIWWGRNDPRNISERCPGAQTNNRAELIAIARVLETTPISSNSLLIKTDSKYSRDCFDKWIHNWVVNGWKNSARESVKNKELIQYISSLLISRHNNGQLVHLQYVKGHSGNEGNDGADQLAVEGCGKPALPERHWDAEREIVENPQTVVDVQYEDIDWEGYAEGVLDDEEFMEEVKNL